MPRQKPPEHQAHQRDPLKSKRAKSRPSKPPKPQPKPKPGNRTDKIRLIRGQPKGPSAKTPEQAQPKPDPPPAYPFQRSEEHTSELQSLMRISYAVFCLKKKKTTKRT